MSNQFRQLEEALQQAIDATRQADGQISIALAAIDVADSVPCISGPCSLLSDWLQNSLTDGGHANESLIGAHRWTAQEAVSCLGWCLFFGAATPTNATQAEALSVVATNLVKAVVAEHMPDLKSFTQGQ